jgi:2-(3-amino-3-carboxypropyl)histidine synthase
MLGKSRKSKVLERIDFESVLEELKSRNVKKIGIQLPDGLKFFASDIAGKFEGQGYEVTISASPSYGACDLDTLLLKEVEVLLHFAHFPLKSIKKVIFVPYFYDYSIDSISKWIGMIGEREISLAGTANYASKFPEVKEFLESKGFEVHLGEPKGRIKLPGQVLGCNYSTVSHPGIDRPAESKAVLFIGDGEFHARGAAIYTGKKVYFFNPLADEFKIIGKDFVDDFLRKRILKVSKAMEGVEKGIGIIVSSKMGQKRLGLARKLKAEAVERGMNAAILYFNEVTPESLANFSYGVYVNTACPRITYDDLDRFEKPILSPQEFEILLGKRGWEDYEMDAIRSC